MYVTVGGRLTSSSFPVQQLYLIFNWQWADQLRLANQFFDAFGGIAGISGSFHLRISLTGRRRTGSRTLLLFRQLPHHACRLLLPAKWPRSRSFSAQVCKSLRHIQHMSFGVLHLLSEKEQESIRSARPCPYWHDSHNKGIRLTGKERGNHICPR